MLDATLALLLLAAISWALWERYQRLHVEEAVDEACDEVMKILNKADEEDEDKEP